MIYACGEALIDMVPDGVRPGAFLARPGGCPYTTSIASARLGARTAFLGRIGSDFLGDALFGRLAENGVETQWIKRADQPATLAFVSRDSRGDARYAFYSGGAADRSLELSDLPGRLEAEARFLAVGSISVLQEPLASSVEKLIQREGDRGGGSVLVSVDPNVRPSLVADRGAYVARLLRWVSLSAVVKASSEDLEWLFPGLSPAERAGRLLDSGAELVAETRGDSGAAAWTRSREVAVPAFRVSVADTIGAGDTFHAALLYRLDKEGIDSRPALAALDDASLRDILAFSQAAAALDCTRVGAEPPRLEEVQRFLAERG